MSELEKTNEVNKELQAAHFEESQKRQIAEAQLAVMQEQERKNDKLRATSILTYIAIAAPVLLIMFIVGLAVFKEQYEVLTAAVAFVSYFAGSISSPLLMHFFGVDKEVQQSVTQIPKS